MISINILSELLRKSIKEISLNTAPLSSLDIIQLCNNEISLPPSVICFKIKKTDSFLIATDHIRSIPIFYHMGKDVVTISDMVSDLLPNSNRSIDRQASEEFILTGYTTGNTTLFNDIKQLEAGEYLYVSENGLQTGFYTRFLTEEWSDLPLHIHQKKLEQILEEVFTSLISNLNGRTAVISLSGGYDSRLIAYWLKKLKYPNIICFTYGRTNNSEMENASNAAKQLGLPWHFIDYMQLPINNYLASETFNKYYQYMANYSSMFFMQDYFAIQFLNEKNIIPTDSVFIPGHTGDVLAGSHLNGRLGKKLSSIQIAEEIFQFHYCLTDVTSQKKKKITNDIAKKASMDFPTSLVFEDWDIRERQGKFIVNSARIYPFFGYNYFLPLWDIKIVKFFMLLPFELKLYKKLYHETLEKIFKENNLVFPNEKVPTYYHYKLRDVKQSIIKYFPFLKNLKQLPVKDPICYREITDVMAEDLQKNNIPICKVYSYNGLIVQWYMAKIQNKI